MKKNALILSFFVVLIAIIGYAGTSEASEAGSIVEHVINNGAQKQECDKCEKKIYEFVYSLETADEGYVKKVTFTVVQSKVEEDVQTGKKKSKKVARIKNDLIITIYLKESVPVLIDGKCAGKKMVETIVSLEDLDIEKTSGVEKLHFKKTEAGNALSEVDYNNGSLSIRGATKEMVEYWTTKGVQGYYDNLTHDLHGLLNINSKVQ